MISGSPHRASNAEAVPFYVVTMEIKHVPEKYTKLKEISLYMASKLKTISHNLS